MKLFLFGLVFGVVLFSGCLDGNLDSKSYFGGAEGAVVPENCASYKGDVCSLFSCMADQCWCDEFEPVLVKGSLPVANEANALSAVNSYLKSATASSGSAYSAKKVRRLNSVFWNVFAENAGGDEEVFTVAADGTIIKTQCGV